MGTRAALQALVPGRVVLLADAASGLPELAVLCGAPHAAPSRGIQLGASAVPAGACKALLTARAPMLTPETVVGQPLRWPVRPFLSEG